MRNKSAQEIYRDRLRLLSEERDHFQKQLINAQELLSLASGKKARQQLSLQAAEILEKLSPSLGLRVQKEFAVGAKNSRGVSILTVQEGSSAHIAGLRPGHVVASVNGVATKSSEELLKSFDGLMAGDQVTCEVDPGVGRLRTCVINVKARELDLDFQTIVELRRISSGVVSVSLLLIEIQNINT
jgi:S1-C subfamily serine protease